MYKIAILGPESSGKSTLARELSSIINADLVEEYAREYFEDKDYHKCKLFDLEVIAQQQFNNSHSASTDKVLISDTEMITMEIWAKDKFGTVPELLLNLRSKQKFNLYILTKPDIPWEYDPLRTDSDRRDYIFDLYLDSLKAYNYKYIIVNGDLHNRLELIQKYLLNFSI